MSLSVAFCSSRWILTTGWMIFLLKACRFRPFLICNPCSWVGNPSQVSRGSAMGDHCYFSSFFLSFWFISFLFLAFLCNCMIRDQPCVQLSDILLSAVFGLAILSFGSWYTCPTADGHPLIEVSCLSMSELIDVATAQFSFRAQHCVLSILYFLAKSCLVC